MKNQIKNITTKSLMSKVANELGMDLVRNLSIFSEHVTVSRKNHQDFVHFMLYPESTYMITTSEYDVIREAVKKQEEKYMTCVFMVMTTTPVMMKDRCEFVHVPCIEINVRMRENK